MWRCWKDHTSCDDAKFVKGLKQARSPFYARIVAAEASAAAVNGS
jgi:hypothetical protein